VVSTHRNDDARGRRIVFQHRPSYNVRLATGLRVFDWFYLGPEVQAFARTTTIASSAPAFMPPASDRRF
jgi:hypothetical protein